MPPKKRPSEGPTTPTNAKSRKTTQAVQARCQHVMCAAERICDQLTAEFETQLLQIPPQILNMTVKEFRAFFGEDPSLYFDPNAALENMHHIVKATLNQHRAPPGKVAPPAPPAHFSECCPEKMNMAVCSRPPSCAPWLCVFHTAERERKLPLPSHNPCIPAVVPVPVPVLRLPNCAERSARWTLTPPWTFDRRLHHGQPPDVAEVLHIASEHRTTINQALRTVAEAPLKNRAAGLNTPRGRSPLKTVKGL
eukprot:gene2920-575_t